MIRAASFLEKARGRLRRAASRLRRAASRLRRAATAAQRRTPELADSIRQVRLMGFLWRESRGDTELIKAKLADNPPAIESAQTSPEQDTELIKAKLANEAEQARLQGRAMRFYLSALGLGAATSKDAVASVAQKHADVRSDLAKSEAATSQERRAPDQVVIDNLKRIGVELRDLDRPEQAAVVYHDLGLNFDDLSDARRSSLAYRRASRLLDKLARSNPSGPAWVARISRLAGIEALLLSALARGRPPVASIVRHGAVIRPRCRRRLGPEIEASEWPRWRDAERARRVKVREGAAIHRCRSNDLYEKYLVLEHRIRKLEGLELGAGDKRNPAGEREGKEKGGYGLQLMSWGDGSNVPTSDQGLIIAGTDTTGLLHIRTFDYTYVGTGTDTYEKMEGGMLHLVSADASGNVLSDMPESSLPAAQAQAIAALKQQFPGLLPPRVLSDAERKQILREATLITGQTQKGDDKWFSRFTPGLRTLRRQAGELASELRRRFNAADRSWSPTAHPIRITGLRALAMRADSAVVSLHPRPMASSPA